MANTQTTTVAVDRSSSAPAAGTTATNGIRIKARSEDFSQRVVRCIRSEEAE